MKFKEKLKKLLAIFRKSDNYYKHIDSLPIYNWFKMKEAIDLKYLYFDYENKNSFPEYFYNIFAGMVFQFEKLDVTLFELMALEKLYEAKYLTEKTPVYNIMAKQTRLKIDKKNKDAEEAKGQTLNEFLNYIELSLGMQVGSIKPKEMSTSRAYSLFYQAVEINKEKNKNHGTAKVK
jgi:hypothetical protein